MEEKEKEPINTNPEVDTNSNDSVDGTNHLEDPVGEETEVEKLTAERDEIKDKYLRLVAEFDNFKRRNAKERIELMQTAGKEVISELLDVLDDCDRAQLTLEKSTQANSAEFEGVLLVFNKLRNKLQARGLKVMETLHQNFDADMHEAITEIPAPTEEMKGKIIDEVMKGYSLNEKVIRHPKVVVGK
ncbi:MAG: nucleotide exchange factor GrpE [Chitinophagaceae bacterium]